MIRSKQSGSHVVAVALLLVVLGVVVFAGYTVMQRGKNSQTATTTSGTKAVAPDVITTKADLNTTARALDSSSSDLNSSIDDTTLDSSMNDLL